MIVRSICFLILNFSALAIGGYFTGKGVPSDWYAGLEKAPWTPPGWVFGAAWTTIMLCFSVYMAYLWPTQGHKGMLISLFAFQWLLNVGWNPAFFALQNVGLGMVIISSLTLLTALFLLMYWKDIQLKSLLIVPYVFWLMIATSLNGYILVKN